MHFQTAFFAFGLIAIQTLGVAAEDGCPVDIMINNQRYHWTNKPRNSSFKIIVEGQTVATVHLDKDCNVRLERS